MLNITGRIKESVAEILISGQLIDGTQRQFRLTTTTFVDDPAVKSVTLNMDMCVEIDDDGVGALLLFLTRAQDLGKPVVLTMVRESVKAFLVSLNMPEMFIIA